MKGLIIRKPWIDLILRGKKFWELRGSNTHIRGEIALIESGSGTVVGTCELIDSLGPLSLAELRQATRKLGVKPHEFRKTKPYRRTHAWVVTNAKRLRKTRSVRSSTRRNHLGKPSRKRR